MKKIVYILFLSVLLAGGLIGCYDDKGNYDYKNINEMTYSIIPAGVNGVYRYKQPPVDTLFVTYRPELSQSKAEDESNLEYLWRVSYTKDNAAVSDSIWTKELTLKYPPRENTSYNVMFRVTDISTNISFYESLQMRTVYPYTNAWLVLNGKEGDRRISAVEEPDSTEYVFTADAYMDLGYGRRFENAMSLIYASSFFSDFSAPECLQVVQADSLSVMSPFTMKESMSYNNLPSVIVENKLKLLYGLDGGPQGAVILVDENRHFYVASFHTQGIYREPKVAAELNNTYRADLLTKAYESNYLCCWDDDRDKFMYYDLSGNGEITLFDEEYNDWKDKEIVWMGLDNKDDKGRMGMALMKDVNTGEYWIYHLDSDGFKITGNSIGVLPVNKNSQFATTLAFEDQFFYTVDSKLYLFSVASMESFELYDAGAPITQLQFRINERTTLGEEYNYLMRCLAMVVNKDSEGEIHEVILNSAGDVAQSKVYVGFGPIQDICFTFLNRIQL